MMNKKLERNKGSNIKTDCNLPKGLVPVGPYTQMRRANGFIFVSGQIPIDPDTGKLIKGNFTKQARQVLENLKLLLKTEGSSLDCVVKINVFMRDLSNFARFNKIYKEYFNENSLPARTCVGASHLLRDVEIEIEAIATTLD